MVKPGSKGLSDGYGKEGWRANRLRMTWRDGAAEEGLLVRDEADGIVRSVIVDEWFVPRQAAEARPVIDTARASETGLKQRQSTGCQSLAGLPLESGPTPRA